MPKPYPTTPELYKLKDKLAPKEPSVLFKDSWGPTGQELYEEYIGAPIRNFFDTYVFNPERNVVPERSVLFPTSPIDQVRDATLKYREQNVNPFLKKLIGTITPVSPETGSIDVNPLSMAMGIHYRPGAQGLSNTRKTLWEMKSKATGGSPIDAGIAYLESQYPLFSKIPKTIRKIYRSPTSQDSGHYIAADNAAEIVDRGGKQKIQQYMGIGMHEVEHARQYQRAKMWQALTNEGETVIHPETGKPLFEPNTGIALKGTYIQPDIPLKQLIEIPPNERALAEARQHRRYEEQKPEVMARRAGSTAGIKFQNFLERLEELYPNSKPFNLSKPIRTPTDKAVWNEAIQAQYWKAIKSAENFNKQGMSQSMIERIKTNYVEQAKQELLDQQKMLATGLNYYGKPVTGEHLAIPTDILRDILKNQGFTSMKSKKQIYKGTKEIRLNTLEDLLNIPYDQRR